MVGQSSDGGADIVATAPSGKRVVVQVKDWGKPVGLETRDETLAALRRYRADIPIIVSVRGFDSKLRENLPREHANGIPLQLWDWSFLSKRCADLPASYPNGDPVGWLQLRPYQNDAVQAVTSMLMSGQPRRAMVVLATGLGKTVVAAESIRRVSVSKPMKVLILAHANELVYQLERSFWLYLRADQSTAVWNGIEPLSDLDQRESSFTFACVDSVASWIDRGGELQPYDLVLVDECHHAASATYRRVLDSLGAAAPGGPQLLGLTATPWHPGEIPLVDVMGQELVRVDLLAGLREGFLANVDYRLYTDNIDWKTLPALAGRSLTPKQVNRTLFIQEWDDAVVDALQSTWAEIQRPRAIVFCGTVDHAITMRDKIRSRGFANAAALYSQAGNRLMKPFERNAVLCDFHDGIVDVICAVDILNEGVDVPDVNLIVFQRVTHSRRIFVQQLGRGLRLAPDKERVIVLDFVSDIRRFAAGFAIERAVADRSSGTARIRLNNKVEFRRAGGVDTLGENFLREWLRDIDEIEGAGEDVAVLRFPPYLADIQ
jgi:superfamily II DNA or RNA helicase